MTCGIGYAYIPLNEYKELIKENTELEIYAEQLRKEVDDIKNMYRAMEENVLERIYDECDWNLSHLEKGEDGEFDRKSYAYIEMEKTFKKYNISNLDYIYKQIIFMKDQKNREVK